MDLDSSPRLCDWTSAQQNSSTPLSGNFASSNNEMEADTFQNKKAHVRANDAVMARVEEESASGASSSQGAVTHLVSALESTQNVIVGNRAQPASQTSTTLTRMCFLKSVAFVKDSSFSIPYRPIIFINFYLIL